MKLAAYQAPLLPSGSMEAIGLIRERVAWCEAHGVEFLCCPEAILGGLADEAPHPTDIALNVARGDLDATLKPLASETVTLILGFTEITDIGQLYNTAAVFQRGAVVGLYRKQHPAIRKSVYQAADGLPVFTIDGLTFGILICNDSNDPELARRLAVQGARVLFIPTNNALPPAKADVVAEARRVDVALAKANRLTVVRADVAGHLADRISYGSSGIVDANGTVLQAARPFTEELLVAEV